MYPKVSLKTLDHYTEVPIDDPIRRILCQIPTFEKAVRCISESDFQNYGFFVRLKKDDYEFQHESNLFFERIRNFTITSGSFAGTQLFPYPPVYVYRKKKQPISLMVYNFSWLVENILPFVMTQRTRVIRFTASQQTRDIMVNEIVYNQIRIHPENNEVPLLVLSTPQKSLDFAEFVMELIHCCSKENEISVMNKYNFNNLSADRRRKFYDIFPNEFITIPKYILDFLKSIDQYEFSNEDVQELSYFYKNC